MSNPALIKNYTAEADVSAFRIVKFGSSDGSVLHATAATDRGIGVVSELPGVAGDRVDVVRSGIADVEFGGTVTRGAKIVSDATGKAVAASPSAGANVEVIGIAEESGVSGDIARILISPSVMQG